MLKIFEDGVRYLTPGQVSARYDGAYSTKTLANWRSQRRGPTFVKLGGRILYPLDRLERWEESNTIAPAEARVGASRVVELRVAAPMMDLNEFMELPPLPPRGPK
jgi:hypothetical protein